MRLLRRIIAALLLAAILTLPSHAEIEMGDAIDVNGFERLVVGRVLGEGGFGKVFDVAENETNIHFALKVTKNRRNMTLAAAERELVILKTLVESKSPNKGKKVCLKVIAEIDPDEKEKCFLFPRLGMNVFDFILKKNQRRPLPLAIIKAFAWQLLRALSFLHEIGITHGDLKPDNYLFFNATVSKLADLTNNLQMARIILIDFGLAKMKGEEHRKFANLMYNRAPETVLGQGWDPPSDMWAFGCNLMFLYLAFHVFGVVGPHEQGAEAKLLAAHETVLQRPYQLTIPKYLSNKARADKVFGQFNRRLFLSDGRVNFNRLTIPYFYQLIRPLNEYKRRINDPETDNFFDFVWQCFIIDPKLRLTANRGLKHRWFHGYDKKAAKLWGL